MCICVSRSLSEVTARRVLASTWKLIHGGLFAKFSENVLSVRAGVGVGCSPYGTAVDGSK